MHPEGSKIFSSEKLPTPPGTKILPNFVKDHTLTMQDRGHPVPLPPEDPTERIMRTTLILWENNRTLSVQTSCIVLTVHGK